MTRLLALLVLLLLSFASAADTAAFKYKRSDYITESQFTKARKIVLKAHARPNGTWYCAYSKKVVKLDDSLDIDHIVPVHYAALHGLADSSSAVRHRFGGDTLNLVQVLARLNRSKGDKGPAEFMPVENKCFYAQRWVSVTKKYGIKLVAADSVVLAKQLRYCR